MRGFRGPGPTTPERSHRAARQPGDPAEGGVTVPEATTLTEGLVHLDGRIAPAFRRRWSCLPTRSGGQSLIVDTATRATALVLVDHVLA